MTKKLEIRLSGEVGFVGGDLMAIVYPEPECPRSTAERNFNVARMIECWNYYDDLIDMNAELLEVLESICAMQARNYGDATQTHLDLPYLTDKARAAIAKARGQA